MVEASCGIADGGADGETAGVAVLIDAVQQISDHHTYSLSVQSQKVMTPAGRLFTSQRAFLVVGDMAGAEGVRVGAVPATMA